MRVFNKFFDRKTIKKNQSFLMIKNSVNNLLSKQNINCFQGLTTCIYLIFNSFKPNAFPLKNLLNNIVNNGFNFILSTILIGSFMGSFVAFQLFFLLKKMGAIPLVGVAVNKGMVCDFGSFIVALMTTGNIGVSICSEIGEMNKSEQLDSLRSIGISPIDFVCSPKILSLIISLPILTAVYIYSGIFTGNLIATTILKINKADYYRHALMYLTKKDIILGVLIKPIIFAMIISSLACYYGLKSSKDGESIRKESTSSVSYSYILIIATNFLFTLV